MDKIKIVNTLLITVIVCVALFLSITVVRVMQKRNKVAVQTPKTGVVKKPDAPPPVNQIQEMKRTTTIIPLPVIYPSDRGFIIPRRDFLKEEVISQPGVLAAKRISTVDDSLSLQLFEVQASGSSLSEYATSSSSVHKPSGIVKETAISGRQVLVGTMEAYAYSQDKSKIYVLVISGKGDKQKTESIFANLVATIYFPS